METGLGGRSPIADGQVGLTRRGLLRGAAAVGAASVLGTLGWVRWASAAPLLDAQVGPDPVTALLRAYVSTLVPGPGDDPTGAPGAVEAGAVEQLEAQVPYIVPLLLADITGAALAAHGRPFHTLAYAQREALLIAAFADPVRAPYHLAALAIGAGTFYADFVNDVGSTWMGLGGPSEGYLDSYTDGTGHGQPQADAVPA